MCIFRKGLFLVSRMPVFWTGDLSVLLRFVFTIYITLPLMGT